MSAAKKMQLSAVGTGRIMSPIKTTVYGPPGCGKTTFASGSPGAIYIPTEEGTNALDVARFPQPETFADVLDAIAELASGEHKYRTLVIDTLDALEPLIWAQVCANDPKKAKCIEDVGGGWGKGYVAALDQWRILLSRLEGLRKAKSMNVVLIAHSQVKKFANPEGSDFDRYDLKLAGKGASGLITEWSDVLLFATYEVEVATDLKDRTRGISTGNRIARTVHSGAFEAKNRYSLPDPMPLKWDEYRAAVKAYYAQGSSANTTQSEPQTKEVA